MEYVVYPTFHEVHVDSNFNKQAIILYTVPVFGWGLQYNSPTNQLVVSQVADWLPRRQQLVKNCGKTTNLFSKPKPNLNPVDY